LELVRNDWLFLEGKRGALEKIRNQVSAHNQIKLSPVELHVEAATPGKDGLFEPKKTEIFEHSLTPAFSDIWNTLSGIAPPLGRSISHLAQILIEANVNFDKWRESDERDAAKFWQFQ
jgi:hypothetical protein